MTDSTHGSPVGGSDPTQYAFDDDELDALLDGSLGPGAGSNPVAEFFTEARTARFARNPQPSVELLNTFAATGPSPVAPATEMVPPTTATAVLSTPPPPSAPAPQPPLANGWELESPEIDNRPLVVPGPVYRPSPLEALANALRPTGTKVLMAVSVVLLLFIIGQLAGIIDSPLTGTDEASDDIDTVAGASTTASTASAESSTSIATTSTTLPTTSSSTTDAPTTAATAAPTTTTTIATTTPTISTSSTDTTETTLPDESSTTVPTTEDVTTTESVPSTPTSDGTSSTSTETTIDPPTTIVTSVTITAGRPHTVPDDIPAGTYSALVETEGGCTIQAIHANGTSNRIEAAGGTVISFQLFTGSLVFAAVGCPSTYQVTPAG